MRARRRAARRADVRQGARRRGVHGRERLRRVSERRDARRTRALVVARGSVSRAARRDEPRGCTASHRRADRVREDQRGRVVGSGEFRVRAERVEPRRRVRRRARFLGELRFRARRRARGGDDRVGLFVPVALLHADGEAGDAQERDENLNDVDVRGRRRAFPRGPRSRGPRGVHVLRRARRVTGSELRRGREGKNAEFSR